MLIDIFSRRTIVNLQSYWNTNLELILSIISLHVPFTTKYTPAQWGALGGTASQQADRLFS